MSSGSDAARAFVLGGGGVHGSAEVGMLLALAEAGIRPDLIVGTSIGAINGALFAADPTEAGAERLADFWRGTDSVFGASVLRQVRTLARGRTHLHENGPLREQLEAALPASFGELVVRFQCVAAGVESAAPRWFSEGSLTDALLASSAVPGLLPPVEIEGERYYDGGLVHSIPVGRAAALGATEIYVLHVGRIDTPLSAPTNPLEVGLVAFEISRRHRFVEEMHHMPDSIDVHVLPTGRGGARFTDPSQFRYRDTSGIDERIEAARAATAEALQRGV